MIAQRKRSPLYFLDMVNADLAENTSLQILFYYSANPLHNTRLKLEYSSEYTDNNHQNLV